MLFIGNPNYPRKLSFLNLGKRDWDKYNINWPQYNDMTQSYLHLGIPPSIKSKYRSSYMKFWNEKLPDTLNYTKNPFSGFETPKAVKSSTKQKGSSDWVNPGQYIQNYNNEFGHINNNPKPLPDTKSIEDPYSAIRKMEKPNRPMIPGVVDSVSRWKNLSGNYPPILRITTENTVMKNPESSDNIQKSAVTITMIISLGVIFLLLNICGFTVLCYKKMRLKSREREIQRMNSCVNAHFVEIDENEEIKAEKSDCSVFRILKRGNKRGSEDFYEPVKNHIYEGSKTPKSDDSGGFGQRFKLRRHMSSSTLDAHTKVRDWIAQEIVQRCSPNFLRKTNDIKEQEPKILTNGVINLPINKDTPTMPKPNCQIGSLTGSLKATTNSTLSVGAQEKQSKSSKKSNSNENIKKINSKKENSGRSSKPSNHSVSSKSIKSKHSLDKNTLDYNLRKTEKPQKVSVAVDATPATRSESVLKQEPIELSKSLDYCFFDDKIERCATPIRRSLTMDDIIIRSSNESLHENDNTFKSSVNLKIYNTKEPQKQPEIIQIIHKHSISDPVKDINYAEMFPYGLNQKTHGTFNTFNTIQPPVAFRNDINVTSRDEIKLKVMTPSEALMTIKRRNYPKVLPDFPKPGEAIPTLAQKRLSLPPQTLLQFIQSSELSPSNSELSTPTELKSFSKGPPIPPPRSSSTLGRNNSNNQNDPSRTYERMNSFERIRTLDRNPNNNLNNNYVEMHSNTLPTLNRVNANANFNNDLQKQNRSKNRVNMMDIERSGSFSQSEQSESEREDEYIKENSNYETIRPQPKLIISANPCEPKINERKLIIKPIINKNPGTKTGIPRVLARDNSFEGDLKIISKQKEPNSTTMDPKRFNYTKPVEVKMEMPPYKLDTKGPPTPEELERCHQRQDKAKDMAEVKIKSNSLTRQDACVLGPDQIRSDVNNQKKSDKKETGPKKSESMSKIPKTPVLGKNKKEQKPQSPNRNKQVKAQVKSTAIPQPVPSLKTTNELREIEHSASESSNDTECSAETVKKIK